MNLTGAVENQFVARPPHHNYGAWKIDFPRYVCTVHNDNASKIIMDD